MSRLFIVESPGKLKTLRQILGKGWLLEASVGHTTELASDGPKRLGFDLAAAGSAEKVTTRYVPRGERGRQVLAKLRKALRGIDQVFLATDPDREGEAIAWHLVQQLGLRNYCRVSYTQLTEAAVRRALENPKPLDLSLIAAQRARQCLDKLVGFEVSPLLWSSTGGKSAGRVQSATLHLICDRERERLAFKPRRYWVLKSSYREGFEAVHEPKASEENGVEAPHEVTSAEEARRVAEVARTFPHVARESIEKEESRNPPPPLITSSLQQMAGARHRFSPKHTMQLAQELYEGVNGKGLITYMRTDAVTLSAEFVTEARDWLRQHAPEALAERAPTFKVKAEAQGAHEAIRPTSASLTPEQASRFLKRDQLAIYRLVWERAMASQCKPARLSRAKRVIDCASTRWVARGLTVIDAGYQRFWKNTEDEKLLPALRPGQPLNFVDVTIEEKVTEPPSRYSEPKLVQLMEKKGIGRPSTYASTIATLKDRDYVVLEKNLLSPTALGLATDEALTRAVPELVNAEFTAKMEESLDRIAEGGLSWELYLNQWNREYLVPALVRAREVLRGTARVAPAFRPGPGRSAGPRRVPGAGKKFAGKGPILGNSREKCPDCGEPMRKVRSAKVTGGFFLKCAAGPVVHPKDVVLFRSRRTKQWERPKAQ